MMRSNKFWISLVAFEVVFGLVIFGLTRQYYMQVPEIVSADPVMPPQSSSTWPDTITETDLARFNLLVPGQSATNDPAEISRQANQFFASGQYDRAVILYERLLTFRPDDVDTYNNLGLTLHYIGRSAEALVKLNEGVIVDPTYQRIWLTLGFVSSQVGNTDQARTALTNAVQMGTNDEIRKTATEMLESLPQESAR